MRDALLGSVAVMLVLVATAPLVGAYQPALEPVHAHDGPASQIQDLAYDADRDTIWSVSKDGGVIGYNPAEDGIVAERGFSQGHAVALGDSQVYAAAGDQLWTFDLEAEEWSELTKLQDHAADMAYDAENDVIWVGGGQTVTGYDASDGSVVASHDEHTDGLETIAVHGESGLVASGTTWADEVIVWDSQAETVAHEPDVPSDVGSISALSFTVDGELLIGTDAEDNSWVGMLDLDAGNVVAEHRVHVFAVSEVLYDDERDVIVSTGFDNSIRFYDVDAEDMITAHEHADTIYTADLSMEDDLLWVGDGEERTGQVTGIDVSDVSDSGTEETDDTTQDPNEGADMETGDDTSDDTGDQETQDGTGSDSGDEASESPLGVWTGLAAVGVALVAARRGARS
jgi:WD40 repeat protein